MPGLLERLEQAEQSIAITISSRLSGSMISAELARGTALERWPEKRIAVLDSRSTGPELVLCVFSVLSFLSGKERKYQRKETLTGRGMSGSNRAGRPAAFVSRLSGGRPGLRYPFFSAGLFFEKPRKIYFAGDVSSADGRARRANPSGFLSFLFGSFSFTERKRTKQS